MEAPSPQGLRRQDFVLLAGFCLVYFAAFVFNPHSLGVHETVHCQNTREMLADGDWVVPKKGGEPWLESPPLPQWCTVAVASLFGRCDAEWIVRIGPALVATHGQPGLSQGQTAPHHGGWWWLQRQPVPPVEGRVATSGGRDRPAHLGVPLSTGDE